MKKLAFVGLVALGTLSLTSCDSGQQSNNNETVVGRDTTANTEYEIEEQVVETDTTTRERTVEEGQMNNNTGTTGTGTTGTTGTGTTGTGTTGTTTGSR